MAGKSTDTVTNGRQPGCQLTAAVLHRGELVNGQDRGEEEDTEEGMRRARLLRVIPNPTKKEDSHSNWVTLKKNLVLCCLEALISFSFKDWSQIYSICSLRAFKGLKSGLSSAFLAENLYF